MKITVNEALEKEIKVDDKLVGTMNHTQALAIKDTEANKEKVAKIMKERGEAATQGERQPKTIKSAMLKRMFLSESIFEEVREGKCKLHEADSKQEDPAIDLSKVETSMTSILSDLSKDNKLQSCKTAGDVLELVKKTFEEKGLNTPASNRLLGNLGKAKTLFDAWSTVYNSINKGSKNGVIREANDDDFEADDELWYDMQQFVTDLYSRPDTTRPDEFPKKMYSRVFNRNGVAYDKVFAPTDNELMFEWSDLPSAQDAIKLAKELKLKARGKKEGKDKFNVYIEIPMTSVGQFECVGDWFEDNGLVLTDWLTDTYLLRLAKRGELFANPDKNEEYLNKNKLGEALTEGLKYGQTKYEELVGKIREYWDAPAIDNLCDLMKDIDEQIAYDIVYKCAEFLEEHADEAIEDSQKYPVEKPKAYDSGFVSAKDKQPKKDLLTENVGFDKVLPIVKDWFSHLGDEDCENIAQAFAIGMDKGKDCFEILNSLAKDYSFDAAEFEGICPEIEKLTGLNESVVMNEEAKIITSLEDYIPWGGAVDTWDCVSDEGKIEELDNLLEDVYPEGISLTELNDLLWFEQDWIYEQLGITEESEDDEEEEDNSDEE